MVVISVTTPAPDSPEQSPLCTRAHGRHHATNDADDGDAGGSKDKSSLIGANHGADAVAPLSKSNLKAIVLLSCCWCTGVSVLFIQIASSSAAAKALQGDSRSTATLPLGVLIGSAALSAPLLQRCIGSYGHARAFAAATVAGLIGAFLNLWAVYESSFALLVIGSALQGITNAATNAYRFTASQFATAEFVSTAISYVILGGAAAALFGPGN